MNCTEQSGKTLNAFYDYIRGEDNGCPNCQVYISCEAKTYECGIMVCKNDDDSVLYLSCNDEMITFLGDSVFHSNTTNFRYVESALIFKDRKNREVKITK